MVSKNTVCLWYNGAALDAAEFYARTFPDSAVGAITRAPGDYPAGKQHCPAGKQSTGTMSDHARLMDGMMQMMDQEASMMSMPMGQ